jgi:SET domain
MIRAKTEVKEYLEYLDKEMTVMGILSTVSVATPAGILSAIFGAKSELSLGLWHTSANFVILGCFFAALAAFLFYKQRSYLAWFYGQICLVKSSMSDYSNGAELKEWLREADSWKTWWLYSWGFNALVASFVEYSLAFVWYLYPNLRSAADRSPWPLVAATVIASSFSGLVVVSLIQRHVLIQHKFSDRPWAEFWERFSRPVLPHNDVYTRIMRSPISGVGVFAIRSIPRGTYIFEPDDGPITRVKKNKIVGLSPAIVELYRDFCVLRNDEYTCPLSFNGITPSWFLNESKLPNVAADLSLKFYAIRDIKIGEELTADYSLYSDYDSNQDDARGHRVPR